MVLLVALLLVGAFSSNAIGLFGGPSEKPSTVAPRSAGLEMGPSVPLADPAVTSINGLLKKFEVRRQERKRVAEAIVHSSRRHNQDPWLVASILIIESRGNPFAISPSEAVGIMQIHVPTWANTVDQEGINLFKIEDNIDFGVRILHDYVERYGRDEGVKHYCGWNPDDPESVKNAEAYLHRVQHVYDSSKFLKNAAGS